MKMLESSFIPALTTYPLVKLQTSFLKGLSLFQCPVLLSFALVCDPCFADTPSSTPPIPTKPQSSHINVQNVQNSKGITAWIVEAHEIPVVSVALAFKMAGSIAEPANMAGLTDLLSSTIDEGSGDLNSQEFKNFLLKNNIELSIKADQDVFHVSFRTTKKNINEAFHMLRAILTKPRFEDSTLTRVKNQLLAIYEQSLHNEHTLGSQEMNVVMFGNHPYARTVQQVIKDLPKITDKQLRQFMRERLARNNLLISVVGDITPGELKDYLDRTFGDFPEKATPLNITPPILPNKGSTKTVPLNIPQSLVRFAQPAPSRKDPDWYATFLLIKVLGDGQYESRLWDEIREKRGLAYEIAANLSWSEQAGIILGGTATKNTNVKEVIKLIQKVWNDSIDGISQSELDFVKRRIIGNFPLNFGSTLKIAKALLVYQIDDLGIDYINKRNEIISSITLDDVNRVAKKILNPEQLSFVICGDPNALAAQSLTQDKKQGVSEQ